MSCCVIYSITPPIYSIMNKTHSPQPHSFEIELVRAALKKKRKQLQQQNEPITIPKTTIEWGLPKPEQKKIQPTKQLTPIAPDTPILKRAFCFERRQLTTQVLNDDMYYPPRCSGYDMAYSKAYDTLFVYGGISCASDLQSGLKTHFYKYTSNVWSEVKVKGTYSPMPRFGHTLTACQKEIVLFGGVSEYKEKLKDRCFYADCSLFNPLKSSWRILDACHRLRTRKSHAACAYTKYYIVHGGIDDSQHLISELSWINIESKKPRWKSIPITPRFNHKIIATQVDMARDFLAVFGGKDSELLTTLEIIPLCIFEGDLLLRQPIILCHQMSPREMPIMLDLDLGFIVLGGTDEDCDVVQTSWHYNGEKQTVDQLKISVDFKQLRGSRGVNYKEHEVYILASNSKQYKAVKINFRN